MTPLKFLAELARPFRESTVLVAMVVFAALTALAAAAGLFGLWLAILVVPAFCRFLVRVMQARIDARPVDTMGPELFNLLDNVWMLLPIVLIGGGMLLAGQVAATVSPLAAIVTATALLFLLPASLGALVLTHSPLTALNPAALFELIRRCGPAYLAVPVAVCTVTLGVAAIAASAAPGWLVGVLQVYPLILLFSMTGAVVAASGTRDEVGIPEPVLPPPEGQRARVEQQRKIVLGHAYAFFSRGNSAGGLAHITDFIDTSAENGRRIESFEWFFRRMMDWELAAPGLMLGERYLALLLDAGEPSRALKVLSRCLLADARFRPAPGDRERLLEIARAAGRDDLCAALE